MRKLKRPPGPPRAPGWNMGHLGSSPQSAGLRPLCFLCAPPGPSSTPSARPGLSHPMWPSVSSCVSCCRLAAWALVCAPGSPAATSDPDGSRGLTGGAGLSRASPGKPPCPPPASASPVKDGPEGTAQSLTDTVVRLAGGSQCGRLPRAVRTQRGQTGTMSCRGTPEPRFAGRRRRPSHCRGCAPVHVPVALPPEQPSSRLTRGREAGRATPG